MSKQIEYVELVNEHGEPSGQRLSRTEAKQRRDELLAKGWYMPIVTGVVFDGLRRVLVHRRGTSGHTADTQSGALDHVCGGLPYGMTPEEAVHKEGLEETGVPIEGIKLVSTTINANNFYRYLFVGTTAVTDEELPTLLLGTPEEVSWVGFLAVQDLYMKQQSGEERFVNGFFDDLEAAQQFLYPEQTKG